MIKDFNSFINENLDTSIYKDKLNCGGAGGHMQAPFEVLDMKFIDLKNIIDMLINGKVSKQNFVTEKIDGINLFITWYKGDLYAVRNATQIKNGVDSYFTVDKIAKHFDGRGPIKDAFTFAMKDLKNAISKLTEKQRLKIFGETAKNFINIEIVYPEVVIEIPYNMSLIVFHGVVEYNENNEVVQFDSEYGRMLAGMIKQINEHIQEHFEIRGPNRLKLNPLEDNLTKEKEYQTTLNNIMKTHHLNNNNTLYDYHKAILNTYINSVEKEFKEKIPANIKQGLLNRWIKDDKSYSINQLKKDIENKNLLNYLMDFDKKSKTIYKDNIEPIKKMFLKLGAEVINNIDTLLALNNKEFIEDTKKELQKIKNKLDSDSIEFEDKVDKLKREFELLKEVGIDKIIPTEGIVMMYDDKLIKFTGAFAPMHQIIGMFKFN